MEENKKNREEKKPSPPAGGLPSKKRENQKKKKPLNFLASLMNKFKKGEGKRRKYKIDYKRLGVLIGGVILVIGIIGGGIWFFKNRGGEVKVYEALVQLKDQTSSDAEEDAKNSAKAGDVILVREAGQEWSKTEKISYLILKMKLNEEQAQQLVQPKTKKISEEEALEKGIVNEEMLKEMPKEEKEQMLVENVLFREYRVKIEELEFDFMKVREKQPFEEEVFGWEVVQKK